MNLEKIRKKIIPILRAVERDFEIIGEAVKRLSAKFTKMSECFALIPTGISPIRET